MLIVSAPKLNLNLVAPELPEAGLDLANLAPLISPSGQPNTLFGAFAPIPSLVGQRRSYRDLVRPLASLSSHLPPSVTFRNSAQIDGLDLKNFLVEAQMQYFPRRAAELDQLEARIENLGKSCSESALQNLAPNQQRELLAEILLKIDTDPRCNFFSTEKELGTWNYLKDICRVQALPGKDSPHAGLVYEVLTNLFQFGGLGPQVSAENEARAIDLMNSKIRATRERVAKLLEESTRKSLRLGFNLGAYISLGVVAFGAFLSATILMSAISEGSIVEGFIRGLTSTAMSLAGFFGYRIFKDTWSGPGTPLPENTRQELDKWLENTPNAPESTPMGKALLLFLMRSSSHGLKVDVLGQSPDFGGELFGLLRETSQTPAVARDWKEPEISSERILDDGSVVEFKLNEIEREEVLNFMRSNSLAIEDFNRSHLAISQLEAVRILNELRLIIKPQISVAMKFRWRDVLSEVSTDTAGSKTEELFKRTCDSLKLSLDDWHFISAPAHELVQAHRHLLATRVREIALSTLSKALISLSEIEAL